MPCSICAFGEDALCFSGFKLEHCLVEQGRRLTAKLFVSSQVFGRYMTFDLSLLYNAKKYNRNYRSQRWVMHVPPK